VRRQQAVETRERIIEAACTLLRRSGIRDWRALTIRGVALQAEVNERTVYRYFGNERGLRDAVMHRLEEKAGIELEGMRLEDVAGFGVAGGADFGVGRRGAHVGRRTARRSVERRLVRAPRHGVGVGS
jgi:AcrR family transcriptional regulator